MARRRWIKLWTQEVIYGTTLKELEPDERAVWFELLCLAGDSIIPGRVCINENCPYTDEQLCKMLNVNSKLLHKALTTLKTAEKIKTNGDGIIEICNFVKYQGSEEDIEKHRNYMAKYMKNYRDKKKIETTLD